MATFKNYISTIIIIVFGVFNTTCYVASAYPNTDLVIKICNGIKCDQAKGPGICDNIGHVINEVTDYTSPNGYSYYGRIPSGGNTDIAYGFGACYGQLSKDDCDQCMLAAQKKIEGACPDNTGAQVQLQDCRIRYELYPFTG